MTAGAAAGDADLVRVDAELGGVGANEADGALEVADNLVDVEARLRAVHDDERREPVLRPATVADAVMVGVPSAADDFDDRGAVRLGRSEDVHRQRHAVMLGIDDVGDAGNILSKAEGAGEGE